MKKEEYLDLLNITRKEALINAKDLQNKSERTLLYGYDCNRNTFHVYIKDAKIHVVRYNSKNIEELDVKTNDDYIPNKRVYAEYSDYEFCKLLLSQDVYIPFTAFKENSKCKDSYIGKTI